jgi:hypothetical protein
MAVKFLRDDLLGDEDAVRRFIKEVRLLDTLDHPNVVPVLGRNLSKRPPWFVMPRADSSLGDELGEHTDDRDWVIRVFRCILDGMAHAHDGGVIHRDLKPGNVLFIDDEPVVSDFGLGKQVDHSTTYELTQSAAAMGTLAYMAPEQFDDAKRAGAAADVYALGKILWQMLSGRGPRPLQRPDLDRVPPEFRAFISRCCEDQPDDRYPNATEALAAFDVITSPAASTVVDPPLERAEQLVQDWLDTPVGPDLDVLRELDDHLQQNADEERMYFELVPRLPGNLLEQYVGDLGADFAQMLAIYDRHITGSLPFSYCDVVANFYSYVFGRTADPQIHRLVLTRLIEMGASHNRFHVGDVVARILSGIQEQGTAQLAAEVIRADPDHARWFDSYVKNLALLSPIAEAFADIRGGEADDSNDDIPF